MRTLRDQLARLPVDPYLLMLMGTVGLAFALPAAGAARTMVEIAVKGAVAALFFLYGARLSAEAVWSGLTRWRLQALVFASTFVLFPLLGLGITALIRPYLPAEITMGLIFLCVLPSTVQSSIAFTSIAGGNIPAALCSASMSNLMGVVLTPVLASMLLPARDGVSPSAIGDIALQILLPFVLGQAARKRLGEWLLAHKSITTAFDRGSILLIVYAAFSAGMVAGVWRALSLADLGVVIAIDVVLLALVIVITTLVSRRLGFSREDEIAIVFCGSKKSMAGGIPMANILFPGHAVSLIVLPLMIFHQAQLFVCATLARRYAARRERPAALGGSQIGLPQA